jgi:hypothetical protein
LADFESQRSALVLAIIDAWPTSSSRCCTDRCCFGGGPAAATGRDQLVGCERLVARLRAQALPQQLADFAGGGVRVVQFHADGSALAAYLAADRRLGAQLTLSQHGGRWLIDSVAGGAIAARSSRLQKLALLQLEQERANVR